MWNVSRQFCSEIYIVTPDFPENEKFGLTNQLRRAAVSVPSKIAEGCSRSSNKDFSRFLEIAIGSLYEIETQLLIAFDLGYIQQEKSETLQSTQDRIIKMTSRFRSSIQ